MLGFDAFDIVVHGLNPSLTEIKAKPHFVVTPLTPPEHGRQEKGHFGDIQVAAGCVPTFLQDRKGISELGSLGKSWDGLFFLYSEIMPLLKTHSGLLLLVSPHSVELKSVSFSMPVILGNFQEVLPVLWPCRGFPNEALTDLRSLFAGFHSALPEMHSRDSSSPLNCFDLC